MRNTTLLTFTLLLGFACSFPAMAEESTMKEGAKKVGQETGAVVRKVGEGGKQVGKKVAEVAREVGHATRDGAKEFVKAVKGESGADNAAQSNASTSSPTHKHKSD